MFVDVFATAMLAVLPFVVGFIVGMSLSSQYRFVLFAITGVPAVYFTGNLLVALAQQGLEESLLLGIPLGISPVFIMLLTAGTAGPFLGIATASWWEQRQRHRPSESLN